jgi:hypothetical protein
MKTKVLIISFLIVALLGAFTLKAQDTTNGWRSLSLDKGGNIIATNYLIADETMLAMPVNENKTEAKITCDNEKVFNELFKSHGTLFKRFTCTWKTDRHGRYKHYVIYLAKGDAELIVNWAKTNL